MQSPDRITPEFPLVMEQGADFNNTFNWYAGGKVVAPIANLTVGAPTIITVTAHGMPTNSDTPVIVSGVEGAVSVNADLLGIEWASYIDANSFSLPISTVGEVYVAGTGEITWFKPGNITGFTAEMHIRKNWYSTAIIHTLTTENGGLTLTEEDASVAIFIAGATTGGFTFTNAVYDIKMIDPGGLITRAFQGSIYLDKAVTR